MRLFPLVILCLAVDARPVRADLRAANGVIDLGDIRGGRKLVHRFELTNAGALPVEILEVQRGCGCLAPRLEQRLLPAGGTTGLVVELRTLGQADGPHSWNLQVSYRAGQETRILPVTLRGTVKNDITVQPAILGLIVTKSVRQEITLTDSRNDPLRVIDAEARGPGLWVTAIERAGRTTKVQVTAEASRLAPGRHEGRLTITTDDPDYGQLEVPIVVTKATAATVRAAPEHVVLRFAAGATSASALVRLRSPGDQAVRIAKIEPSIPELACTWAPGPGTDATLKIQMSRSASAVQGHVDVHWTAPASEVLTIPVTVQTTD
ncbi:MAG: DUF1573 domain-containing protein [Gemmataceae bacterium]|nr:DUF1573 domain-containing protein [Gemmataceae bacterium]